MPTGYLAHRREARRLAGEGDFGAALAEMEQALAIATEQRTQCEAGFIAWRAGQPERARTLVDAALARMPRIETVPTRVREPWAMCLYNAGLVRRDLGDREGARQAFQDSLRLRPHPAVRRALAALSPARASSSRPDSPHTGASASACTAPPGYEVFVPILEAHGCPAIDTETEAGIEGRARAVLATRPDGSGVVLFEVGAQRFGHEVQLGAVEGDHADWIASGEPDSPAEAPLAWVVDPERDTPILLVVENNAGAFRFDDDACPSDDGLLAIQRSTWTTAIAVLGGRVRTASLGSLQHETEEVCAGESQARSTWSRERVGLDAQLRVDTPILIDADGAHPAAARDGQRAPGTHRLLDVLSGQLSRGAPRPVEPCLAIPTATWPEDVSELDERTFMLEVEDVPQAFDSSVPGGVSLACVFGPPAPFLGTETSDLRPRDLEIVARGARDTTLPVLAFTVQYEREAERLYANESLSLFELHLVDLASQAQSRHVLAGSRSAPVCWRGSCEGPLTPHDNGYDQAIEEARADAERDDEDGEGMVSTECERPYEVRESEDTENVASSLEVTLGELLCETTMSIGDYEATRSDTREPAQPRRVIR